MDTYREAVSRVINTLKLNNKDEHVSRRYVLSLFKSVAKVFLSQRLMDRTIYSEMNLYTDVSCFDFEKVDVKECDNIEFRMCKTLMKSKKPLPELVFSRLGASVKEINSLDGEYKFIFLDKGQYKRNKNRKYSIKGEVYIYLGSDNHLYIPDEEIYTVDLTVLTISPEEVNDCKKDKCKSNWDYNLIIPDKLTDAVFKEVLQVMGIQRGIQSDQNPNGIAGN